MSKPIDVKTAVRKAAAYLLEFQEFIPVSDIRLEETEYDDKGSWLITLSSIDKTDLSHPLASLGKAPRSYRIFRIDASNGEVRSMKVRSLQPLDVD
jgi:hypothetical protein